MTTEPSAENRKSRFALLVGISQFKDKQFCDRPLPSAKNDVHDFKRLLCKDLGWEDDNCLVLPGKISKLDLIKAFNAQIEAVRKVGDTALFLFYISTHGQFFDEEDQSQTGVLLTHDTDLTNVPTALETGISNQFLSGYMRETRSLQKVIISDACFSGPATSAHFVTPLSFYKTVDAAVLASSRWESFVEPKSRNSLFTECLIAILQQAQGTVALPTFFESVWSLVRQRAASLGKDQEPILSHQGGVIVLGYSGSVTTPTAAFSFTEIHRSCTAILENQLRLGSQDALTSSAHYVARQQTESRFWNFVAKPDGATAFTIVGSAGAGKSTTMAHLSREAAQQGHLVLWLGEEIGPNTTPMSLIDRSIERLAPGLTAKDAVGCLPNGKQLLVFFDAVNEWPISMTTVRVILTQTLSAAVTHSLRLVVSCRENSWPEIQDEFNNRNTFVEHKAESDSTGVVSSRLTAFTEQELERALEVYKEVERFAIASIARQPLFVRIFSQLAQASKLDPAKLSLLEVLDAYFDIRVRKVSSRILLSPTEVTAGIDLIVTKLAGSGKETLTRAVFFSELTEPLAVALLDEGLFKYSAEEITVEADIVHEHLLSRVLPSDIFDSEAHFLAVTASSRLAPGAALLRLSGVKDRDQVVKALKWIDQNNPFDVLDALERLPALTPYWSFFDGWLRQEPSLDSFVANALVQRVRFEIEFCLKAARVMFANENFFAWEKKRWRDVPYGDFRERVETMGGAPKLLEQCAMHEPVLVVSVLLNDWLQDRTPLEGGSEARICDVAETYVVMLSKRFPEIVFAALTRLIHDQPESQPIRDIINQLARAIPDETIRSARAWKEHPRYVLSVIRALGKDFSAPAMALAQEAIRDNDGNASLVESIIAAAASFYSREALNLVVSMKDRPELINGLIIAITSLHVAFPEECESIAKELCWKPRLPAETLSYASDFYKVAAERSPDDALEFFRRALALELNDVARSISSKMIDLAASRFTSTKFHALIEERLRIETDPTTLFNYAIAVGEYRKLRTDDFDWLSEWIQRPSFHQTRFVLDRLLASDISDREIADLVFLLDDDRVPLPYVQASPRLKALAEVVIQDHRFGSLREYSKRVWFMVAQGQDPRDASHAAF